MIEVRDATIDDDPPLRRIDRLTRLPHVTPTPPPPASAPFFGERTRVEDVVVAEVDGTVAGYAKVVPATPHPASRHVVLVAGLGVDPAFERRGVGRALVEAVVGRARAEGRRRVTLRVLSSNPAALRLYESCGFVVEGVLRDELLLAGRYVDDVLMAYTIA